MSNLSGFWVGHYAYNGEDNETVDFDAEITQTDTVLTGVITEPNSFALGAGELLTATLTGGVSGATLTFIKAYKGEDINQPPIIYNGSLTAEQTEINGVWNIAEFSGTFEMRRDGPAIGVEAKTASSALEQVLEKAKPR
ncbi:MAG: hypothetical protein ACSHXY_12190 [Alphaproteobacteria bacterium]